MFAMQVIRSQAKYLVFFPLFAAALPWLFRLTKENRVDRFIGELSYPLYLTHLLVFQLLRSVGSGDGFATALASVPVSILLLTAVERRGIRRQ